MASLHFASRRLAIKGAVGRQLQRDKQKALAAYRALFLAFWASTPDHEPTCCWKTQLSCNLQQSSGGADLTYVRGRWHTLQPVGYLVALSRTPVTT